MTDNERSAHFLLAYNEAKERLTMILYDEDPDGMGSTASAPLDEYAGPAARLLVRLRGCETEAEVRAILTAAFSHVSNRLVARVHETWIDCDGPNW